nr:hypothetical protein [Bacteroidota bacterium]
LSEAKSRSEAVAGNGRMYDAALCRFLSPDPHVQMPDYSQNFNRYSYALNNPLVYTDPSGEFAWIPFLAYTAVQGIISGDMAKNRGAKNGFWGGFATGIITAAATQFISPYIGAAINGTGFLAGAASNMVAAAGTGFITYGAASIVTGEPFDWQGWGLNIVMAGAIGGMERGFDTVLNDRNFLTGKPNSPHYEAILEDYPHITQTENNCKNATIAEVDQFNGGKRTQEYFQTEGDKFNSDFYIKNGRYPTLGQYFDHFNFTTVDAGSLELQHTDIGKAMTQGNPTVIDENVGGGRGHTITIVKIRQWKPGGKVKIWFSDPQEGIWKANYSRTVLDPNFNRGSYLFFLNN